jgi:hypothetical protein
MKRRQTGCKSFVFLILEITLLFSVAYLDCQRVNPLKIGGLLPERRRGWVKRAKLATFAPHGEEFDPECAVLKRTTAEAHDMPPPSKRVSSANKHRSGVHSLAITTPAQLLLYEILFLAPVVVAGPARRLR